MALRCDTMARVAKDVKIITLIPVHREGKGGARMAITTNSP